MPHAKTGPQTPEGKAAVSQNARKHGLTGRRVLLSPEDETAYAELRAQIHAQVRPGSNVILQHLCDQLLHAQWLTPRAQSLEERALQALSELNFADPQYWVIKKEHERLARYRRQLELSHRRAIAEIAAIQKNCVANAEAQIQSGLAEPLSCLVSAPRLQPTIQQLLSKQNNWRTPDPILKPQAACPR